MTLTRTYPHFCEKCRYLETVTTSEWPVVDWYFHPNTYGGTMLGRYGAGEGAYFSAPLGVLEHTATADLAEDSLWHAAKELVRRYHLGSVPSREGGTP